MKTKISKIPILIILVGESGSGKTTFVKMMDCEENWFESSKAMTEKLIKNGKPVNHNAIHLFATKAYRENPYWQVPKILDALKGKKFLLFDGPRRIKEVKMIISKHPKVIMVIIAISSNRLRCKRLKIRDKIDKKDFARLLKDESEETELKQIIKLADFTIFNDGSLKDIRKKAEKFKMLLNI